MARPTLTFRPQRHEEREQISLMQWCALIRLKSGAPLSDYVAAIPNGGYRTAFEAARFKAAGVMPGFPDLELFIRAGSYTGLHIEMKYGRNKVTDHQLSCAKRLREQGRKVVACWSWHEAAREIRTYLGSDAAQWPIMEYDYSHQVLRTEGDGK